MNDNGAVAIVAPAQPSIVEADPSLVVSAISNYRAVQAALDQAMPDCIMSIQGKKFRKKMYWRGVATAFNLRLEMVSEQRVEFDKPISEHVDEDEWGWVVVYRATASNGRSCDGDGLCYASEKLTKQGYRSAMMTDHNIRSHAHTRAKNRAISDLVGFGEVSADEVKPPSAEAEPQTTERKTMQQGNITKLGTALYDQANRLLDQAVERSISCTYQDEASMADALKVVVYGNLGVTGIYDSEVDGALKAIGLAVLNDDGSISIGAA